MSIKCITRVWEHSQQKGSALLLMLAIADFAGDDGKGAFPSIKTLAKRARMSERNVQILLRKLEESKELTIEEGGGPGGTNLYTIKVKKRRAKAGGEKSAGVKGASPGGESQRRKGVKQVSPNPSVDPSVNPIAADAADAPPDPPGDQLDSSSGEPPPPEGGEKLAASEPPPVPEPKNGRMNRNDVAAYLEWAFVQKTYLPRPDYDSDPKKFGKLWKKPLLEIAGFVNYDPLAAEALIARAISKLRGRGCDISSPESVLKTCVAIVGEWRRGEISQPDRYESQQEKEAYRHLMRGLGVPRRQPPA